VDLPSRPAADIGAGVQKNLEQAEDTGASPSPLGPQLHSRPSIKGCDFKPLILHRIQIETILIVSQRPCHQTRLYLVLSS
jgi:hypothetical protein